MGIWRCPSCGTKNPDAVAECLYCGAWPSGVKQHPARDSQPLKKPITAKRAAIWLLLAFPWLLAGAMVWYAADGLYPSPAPGAILVAHYPELVSKAHIGVVVCWFAMLLLLVCTPVKRPVEPRGSTSAWAVALPIIGLLIAWFTSVGPGLDWFAPRSVIAICWLTALILVSRAGHLTLYAGMTVLALLPSLMYVDVPVLSPAWREEACLQARDGRTYYVQRQQVLQGQSVAFTEEVSRGILFLRTRVIGTGASEQQVHLVRPATQYHFRTGSSLYQPPEVERLVESADGRWIALIFAFPPAAGPKPGCATSLAYDVRARIVYGDREHGRELTDLSPFILVGPSDKLNPDDLEALTEAGRGYVESPSPEVLRAELKNPNPRVREAVARMLGVGPDDTQGQWLGRGQGPGLGKRASR